jgi:hypothetical protein
VRQLARPQKRTNPQDASEGWFLAERPAPPLTASARARVTRPAGLNFRRAVEARRRTPQSDAELTAKGQVLGFEPAQRLEEVEDEHSEWRSVDLVRDHAMILPTMRLPSQIAFSERTGNGQIKGIRCQVRTETRGARNKDIH